jgi:hypothetical protein
MADIEIWYVLTDKDFWPFTSPSSVMLPHTGTINDLKKIIVEEIRPSQLFTHVIHSEFEAWGHSSLKVSDNNTTTEIEELLSLSSGMFNLLPAMAKVTQLKLEDHLLVVQALRGASPASCSSLSFMCFQ